MTYVLSPLYIFKRLLLIIFILVVANVLAYVASINYSNPLVRGCLALFNLDKEANVPTLYATLTLLFCAILLTYIYYTGKVNGSKFRKYWLGFAFVFGFLSLDEFCSIHEVLMPMLRESYNLSGFLFFSWIIPYGIAVIVLAVVSLPFYLKLPRRTQILFLTAAITFVMGAIGFEALGGKQFELFGKNNLQYFIYFTIEEFLEMLGVAIFIYALLDYIENNTEGSKVKVTLKSASAKISIEA